MNRYLAPRRSLWERAVQFRGLSDKTGTRLKVAAKSSVWPLQDRVPLTMTVLRDGEASANFFVDVKRASGAVSLAYFVPENPTHTQWFSRSAVYTTAVVSAYDYSDPRLGVIRFPTLSDTANDLLFNITEDTGNQITTVPAQVDVVTQVQAEAAARDVVVVERLDDGQWRVAGYGRSVAGEVATLALKVTTSGTCFAVGLDDYGMPFVPSAEVLPGQRIRPSIFKGWLYRITQAGSLPATEPVWWDGNTAGPQDLGSARAEVVRYHRSLAHGPIAVEMT